MTAAFYENNKNYITQVTILYLNPCFYFIFFLILIQNNRFAVNIPRGELVTRLRGQKIGPENKFHARKLKKMLYVAEPIFFLEKLLLLLFNFFFFLSAHTLPATEDSNSFR